MQNYGRIDTWVNNAGVSVYAHFEDLIVEEIDRIIRVDLLGTDLRRQGRPART